MLDAVVDGRKKNCFQESNTAYCGNKIVEEGEECDCGFDDTECQETCCYPRQSDEMTEEEAKKKRCTFKPHAECSPSQGPCCDQQCKFTSIVDDVQCSYEGDCTLASKCDGRAAQCPEPGHKPDNITECNQGTQVSLAQLRIVNPNKKLIICFSLSSFRFVNKENAVTRSASNMAGLGVNFLLIQLPTSDNFVNWLVKSQATITLVFPLLNWSPEEN